MVRANAAGTLARIDASKRNLAMPILIESLSHSNIEVRVETIWHLTEIGEPAQAAVPALVEALNDENSLLFSLGLEFEVDLAVSPISAKLRQQFINNEISVSENATIQGNSPLWQITDVNQMTYTVRKEENQLNTYENSSLRANIAGALARIDASKRSLAMPILVKALEDEASSVRLVATKALGKIGPPAQEAVPALIEALKDEYYSVYSSAAEALKQIGTPEAMKAVKEYERNR